MHIIKSKTTDLSGFWLKYECYGNKRQYNYLYDSNNKQWSALRG